jgi:MFS family permease
LSAVFLFEMLDNSILNVALPTIGRELHASTTALQWVTGAYAVVFGGLMLAFARSPTGSAGGRSCSSAWSCSAVASLATAFVTTAPQLIAVRVVMGVAAAMTTPGSMALAFRLFGDDGLRVRAINLISTVGLVGLAIGPTAGGLVLAVAPWQVLLLVNVPIARLAIIGVRFGIAADDPAGLHRDPVDVAGAALAPWTIVFALVAPTLFVEVGGLVDHAVGGNRRRNLGAILFVLRERTARHPLLDLSLVAHPLVSSGLAFKARPGWPPPVLGYLVTLQLQLDWGWSPALAAIGLLPQVIVLVAGGAFVNPFVQRAGLERAAWMSAASVVAGLAVYALLSTSGYVFVAMRALRARGRRAARGFFGVGGRGRTCCAGAGEPDHDRHGAHRHPAKRGRVRASGSPCPATIWPRCSPATSPRRAGPAQQTAQFPANRSTAAGVRASPFVSVGRAAPSAGGLLRASEGRRVRRWTPARLVQPPKTPGRTAK